MTKFQTYQAAENAARASIRKNLGWASGNGFLIECVKGYWEGRVYNPTYFKARVMYSNQSSDTRMI